MRISHIFSNYDQWKTASPWDYWEPPEDEEEEPDDENADDEEGDEWT